MAEEIQTIYTDGVGKIHFYGNMIRLDLMDFVPAEVEESGDEKKSELNAKIAYRLVMNPHAFLATYESFVNMIDKLTAAGVLSPVNNNANGEQLPPENPADANINTVGPTTKVEDVKTE